MKRLKDLGVETYALETTRELCGGSIDKKYEFEKIEDLLKGVNSLPIEEDVVEVYKKVKMIVVRE